MNFVNQKSKKLYKLTEGQNKDIMSVNFPAGVVMKLTTEIPNNFDAYYEAARKAQPEINLAKRLGTTERTLRRWKSGEVAAPQLAVEELQRLLKFGMSDSRRGSFKFIDLFAIGGIRIAFESIGGECVFTSEWDAYAQKTYATNFSAGHEINGGT